MEQQNNHIHINTKEIPEHTANYLAAATLDLIHHILQQPGGKAAIDAKIAARKERKG